MTQICGQLPATAGGVPLHGAGLHLNSTATNKIENLERVSAFARALSDTLGSADNIPVLVEFCRKSSVLSAIFLPTASSASSSYPKHSQRKISFFCG
ncbi:hypothetical protein [Tychonema sp. LEGE 07203]|uniref:hypothetical protein n=1 Tax=Tychonema sp. LEGE 07203 TaxID=1828671 RepID=UPI0018824DCF|nr:hypothetical protein [Tychonema sp. LEGE 07203]MBE9093380.1 hypothetical protein [Tychonema sp. LEGE 07203]